MPELVPIYKNRDLYVPAFDVKIRGNDIPRESLSDSAANRPAASVHDCVTSFEQHRATLHSGSGAETGRRPGTNR